MDCSDSATAPHSSHGESDQIDPINTDEYPISSWYRVNGFQRPIHIIAVVSWISVILMLVYGVLFSALVLPLWVGVPLAVIICSSFVPVIVFSVKIIRCDPRDPLFNGIQITPSLSTQSAHGSESQVDDTDDPIERYYSTDDLSRTYWCTICRIPIAPNTKHCWRCNKCIEGFDHHCVVLNNCIGTHNIKQFRHLLVVSTIFFFILMGVSLAALIYSATIYGLQKRDDFQRDTTGSSVVNPDIKRWPPTYITAITFIPPLPLWIMQIPFVVLSFLSTVTTARLWCFHRWLHDHSLSTYEFLRSSYESDHPLSCQKRFFPCFITHWNSPPKDATDSPRRSTVPISPATSGLRSDNN